MYVLKNSGIQQTSNNKGLFTSSKQYAVLVNNFYTSLRCFNFQVFRNFKRIF